VFALLGAGAYGFGMLAARDTSNTIPALAMFLPMMLGPLLALLGFGLWWVLLGDGRWWKRILVVFGVFLAAVGLASAADPSMQRFATVWGLPLAAAITGLALALVPAARWWVAGSLITVAAMAPWLALRVDGVNGDYDIQTSARWKKSVTQAAVEHLADRATVAPTEPVVDRTGSFELTDQTLANLQKEKVPETVLQKLIPLKNKTFSRGEFVEALTKALTNEEFAQFQVLVLSRADLSSVSPADWPGFRGANRDGRVPEASYRGWDGTAPRERWRKDPERKEYVGPAWSSFCVVGDFLFTQEQRGESESVVCYRADTGKEVWARGVPGKHADTESGAGPRATPVYSNGRIFAVTASGNVSCVRASNGEPVWPAVNLMERFGAAKPFYGLSTSPLVVGDLVIIHLAAPGAPRLAALDVATGATRWTTEQSGSAGYSSPHLATIDGASQVLIFNGAGLFGHDPQTGRELWHYDWQVAFMEPTAVQPLVMPDGRVIVGGANVKRGSRCVKVQRQGDGWVATEAWKTTEFAPRFNDVVCVGEYLYGLDSGRLVCFNLATHSIAWKEGSYGAGQLLLVGNKLLVVSETGQLACVLANPEDYEEVWKIDVAKGKTWNHPAIAHGRLFFRNPSVMVCYDLPGYTGKD
jgi:outer membrane protein assembly factor BamB